MDYAQENSFDWICFFFFFFQRSQTTGASQLPTNDVVNELQNHNHREFSSLKSIRHHSAISEFLYTFVTLFFAPPGPIKNEK